MKKQLLLLGGGHAHMLTIAKMRSFIDRGHAVTVVQPSEYHYYSGMGPGVLAGTYQPGDIRFATRKTVESAGGRFVLGKARKIDPLEQLVFLEEQVEPLSYDVLSCNTGSYVPERMGDVEMNVVVPAKPIESLIAGRQKVIAILAQRNSVIGVIGGGPSAIEIAGNLHQLIKKHSENMPSIRLFAGRSFMRGQSPRVRLLARRLLERKGIGIIEEGYVQQLATGNVILENGIEHQVDLIFSAVGVTPSSIFSYSELPVGPDGGLLVNDFLQSSQYNNIFGGGDCISLESESLAKVGVYAVRQNPVLYHNILASLEGGEMKRFKPGGDYLRIYNLGDGEGIFEKWFITFSGRVAFAIKDLIDRRFIARFNQK